MVNYSFYCDEHNGVCWSDKCTSNLISKGAGFVALECAPADTAFMEQLEYFKQTIFKSLAIPEGIAFMLYGIPIFSKPKRWILFKNIGKVGTDDGMD